MRPAGQHVIEVAGTLVRGRVADLRAQVVLGPGQRPAQVRLGRDEVQDLGGQRAVPAQQVLDPGHVQPGGPGQPVPRVPQREVAVGPGQRHLVGARGGHPPVQPVRHRVHRVPGHQPVGGVLAAGDHHQPGHRVGHHVLPGQPGGGVRLAGQQRPQPGVHPGHVLPAERHGQHPVDLGEHVVDVGPAGGRVGLVQGPLRVRGADDPVPSPRDDEQHADGVRMMMPVRDWIRSRGTTRCTPLEARTLITPRPPTMACTSSVHTPVAL